MSLTPAPPRLPVPSLSQFAQRGITALNEAVTEPDFQAALDGFIAENAEITFNGETLSRAEYSQRLLEQRFVERSGNVKFLNTVEVAGVSVASVENAGLVGVFYEVTIVEKIIVFGAPATRTETSSINLIIEQTKNNAGVLIPTKVVGVNQVAAARQDPVTLPGSSSSSSTAIA